jgi:hypothetical protein
MADGRGRLEAGRIVHSDHGSAGSLWALLKEGTGIRVWPDRCDSATAERSGVVLLAGTTWLQPRQKYYWR